MYVCVYVCMYVSDECMYVCMYIIMYIILMYMDNYVCMYLYDVSTYVCIIIIINDTTIAILIAQNLHLCAILDYTFINISILYCHLSQMSVDLVCSVDSKKSNIPFSFKAWWLEMFLYGM